MSKRTVYFRALETDDASLIYKWKNDFEMMQNAVGMKRPVSMAECIEWVTKRSKHDPFNYWFAICLNDGSGKMIGYTGINNIHFVNSSATSNALVIGDKESRDGISWIEANLMIYEFVFEKLHLNRFYGGFSETQHVTYMASKLFYATIEGIERQGIWLEGAYHDMYLMSLLREEYMQHKINGEYELPSLLKRYRKFIKEKSVKPEGSIIRTDL